MKKERIIALASKSFGLLLGVILALAIVGAGFNEFFENKGLLILSNNLIFGLFIAVIISAATAVCFIVVMILQLTILNLLNSRVSLPLTKGLTIGLLVAGAGVIGIFGNLTDYLPSPELMPVYGQILMVGVIFGLGSIIKSIIEIDIEKTLNV